MLKPFIGCCCLLFSAHLFAASPPDPLKSVQWETMYNAFFKEAPIIFDESISILAPVHAENSMSVPILIDANKIKDIQKIVVVVDFNPLPKVLEFEPQQALATVGFSIKLQQSSPIRAAVLTRDGWHVNGRWIEAAGGGCTLPSLSRAQTNWDKTLGKVTSRQWQFSEQNRLRFRVMHPMDTGLVSGIPAFFIEQLQLQDAQGKTLLTLSPFEPISENPLFTIELPKNLTVQLPLTLQGIDNNGNKINAELVQ